MQIFAPVHFRHPGELDDPNARRDPRLISFTEETVEVDLGQCRFIRPPALLWSLMYPLVAHLRSKASVVLPRDPVAYRYLECLGLPRLLANAGITVYPRPSEEATDPPNAQVVLPLTKFETSDDAEAVINLANDSLAASGLGAVNVRPLVGLMFSELALNAVQHADSPVAAYGYVQYYEYSEGPRFVCGVADGGVGILQSLKRNRRFRHLRTDAHAIDVALQERMSGTHDPNRGIGLHWVTEQLASPGRRLTLHSVSGAAIIEGPHGRSARYERLFPGTAACIWIPA